MVGLRHFTAPVLKSIAMIPTNSATTADQQRWDERYRSGCGPCQGEVAPWVAAQQPLLRGVAGELALDVACGTGRHSLWLAEMGWQVDAVDVSAVGLAKLVETAQARSLSYAIHPFHADLSIWRPEPARYDLILVSFYLERPLLPALKDALKPGGLLLYTTFHTDLLRLRPHDNPAYLLQPGELLSTFSAWEILAYEERRLSPGSVNRSDCTSSLLVRK